MERSRYSRLIGVIYITGAVFGIIISLAGLIGLWATKSRATRAVGASVILGGQIIDATRGTVEVAAISLDQAATDLQAMQDIINQVGTSLEDSTELISTTSAMVGKDMVSFVGEFQASMKSVETSARIVDDFLRVVGGIPFVGQRYRPDVPLEESFAQVNRSLDPLPKKFTDIQRQLDVASANVAVMQTQIESLNEELGGVNQSLERAQEQAEEYRTLLRDMRDRWTSLQRRLPVLLTVFYLAITALLVWIFISQLGILIHGIELYRSKEE
jgi:peptidoglycan hydrolase CwlO-like protein